MPFSSSTVGNLNLECLLHRIRGCSKTQRSALNCRGSFYTQDPLFLSAAIRMRHQRSSNMDMTQDLEEHFNSMTSRLKLNFRSTRCSGQSFPYFNKQLCKENLPCELQELILTHLPALKLLELKAVCRSWRDVLQSSSFKEKWQLMRGGCGDEMLDVWVMKSKQEEDLIAYVPALDKYFLFLSLICSSVVMTLPPFTFSLKEVCFLCACGPMIVLGKKDWRSVPSFLMYDLYSSQRIPVQELRLQVGSNVILPSSHPVLFEGKDRPPYGGLAVEIQSVNDNGSHPLNQLFVYKFATHTWDCYPQSSAVQADFSDMSAVLCGEYFQYDQEENTLYAWSLRHWSKVRVTFSWPPHDMMNRDLLPIQNTEVNTFKVVTCEGHILLLTSTVQQERGVVTQCFRIWKLMKGAEESVTWNWFEISRTPPELCLKSFSQESFLHPTAMCDESRICILSSSHEFSPAMVYDVKHGSWYHLHGVFKDMQALFALRLRIKIDGLQKDSNDVISQRCYAKVV